MLLSFILNGQPVTLDTDPARPLLTLLREDLGLTGTKQACDMEGECGACTVIVDGEAQRSCLLLAGELEGRTVETVEGLGTPDHPHPLQTAFLAAGAVQCGYCTPGMLMSAKALLDHNPRPSRVEIVAALGGNFCRCTGYASIIEAVQRATELPGQAQPAFDPAARRDGFARVSGATRFAGDITLQGLHHLAFVRSPHHHARVLSIDSAPAQVIGGVVAVLTARDIPGENIGLGGYSVGEPLLAPVGDRVRMLGEAIALVIGETRAAAEAGAAAVQVRYEVLPHRFDVAGVRAGDALRVHADGDILAVQDHENGDVAGAFAASDVVLAAEYTTSFQAHMATEREAGVAYWEDGGGALWSGDGPPTDGRSRLVVVYGMHNPHWAAGHLARILALPPERIRVITPPTGGSFGGRQDVYPAAAVALAACCTGRPVRLEYARREVMIAAPKRHPYAIRAEIGAARGAAGARLTALRVDMDANTGAYDSAGRYIPGYAVVASPGPYRWRAVEAHARTLHSNGPKAGQFRGFGTPQPVFAIECLLDELCQALGEDPLGFRLRNALLDGEPTGLGYPSGETLVYRELLAALQADYDELTARTAAFNAEPAHAGRRRGVGVAGMMYRFGKFGVARSQAEMELAADGRFVVYASAGEYGQGIETTFLLQAAHTLGISPQTLRLVNADTAQTLDGDIAGASRAAYWVGSAIVDAARRLRAALLGLAAELLDAPPTALELAQDAVHVRDDVRRAVSLPALAAELDRAGQSRRVRGVFDLTHIYPPDAGWEYLPFFLTAANVAEVEVDEATGAVKVLTLAAAHDAGHVLNPRDAVGQVEGGLVMGLGAALMEELTPGVSAGFSTYAAPTATAVPELRVHLLEAPGRYADRGVKGLGEATILAAPPAIINAVSRSIGARIRSIPATPERVLAALAPLRSDRPPAAPG